MTTLIELHETSSSYTYDLIVNETRDNTIVIEPEKDVVDIENVVKGKIVLFSINDCEKCEVLSALLDAQRINHQAFNINNDPKLYRQFMNFINKELVEETKVRFPVIWNKSYTIFGYDDLSSIIEELK